MGPTVVNNNLKTPCQFTTSVPHILADIESNLENEEMNYENYNI